MSLLDLPLVLFRDIISNVLLEAGVIEALRLREVNRTYLVPITPLHVSTYKLEYRSF